MEIDHCPKCGSKKCLPSDSTARATWLCGSSMLNNAFLYRSHTCFEAQLTALAEENAKLKASAEANVRPIANLPAAGDELRNAIVAQVAEWEQYIKQVDDGEELPSYDLEAMKVCIADMQAILSPPQQEAGDEPGK